MVRKVFPRRDRTGLFSIAKFSLKAGSPSKRFGPVAVISTVHDRMPVILDPDGYDLWLDPGMRDVRAASDLLKPYDARRMRCYPVGTWVNHVANDDAECSAPVELARLFS